MLTSYQLESPALEFGADGVPRSDAFDDVYFDKEAGLEETRYVFLEHNRLAERLCSITQPTRFSIAETGFGTGLNFLCALQLFLEQAPPQAWLHFTSVEKFPLSHSKLQQALEMWPSLAPLTQALLKYYPTLCYGLHRIELPEYRTTLTLWFGEASEGFSSINGQVDAWFLDGFAPSKNPEMWSSELFESIQRLSHSGTTFATFTAAGIVRRGLQDHGFKVQKVKGFGHKREMMIGHLDDEHATPIEQPPWYAVRSNKARTGKVLVVGSGLAGATTAYALAEKGIEVEVWEQADAIATGASGNEQGMLYPKLGASDTPVNRFYLTAYLYAHRFYQAIAKAHPTHTLWCHCGLIQRPKTSQEQTKFDKIIAANLYPKNILDNYDAQGLHLPLSGWVRPKALCETLLAHPNITLKLAYPLTQLERQTSGAILAHSTSTAAQFQHVIICTANQQQVLDEIQTLPTKAIRGQVTQLDIDDLPSNEAQEAGRSFTQVICADGYVSPALNGQLNFGATYDLNHSNLDNDDASHQANLTKLERLLDIDLSRVNLSHCRGRSALRCTVNDYTPIVGPISQSETLVRQYGPLRTNAKWQSTQPAEFADGIYINLGHGSRGLVSAPLSASYLASLIVNEPAPIEQSIIEALHPNRFVIRQLKRGEV